MHAVGVTLACGRSVGPLPVISACSQTRTRTATASTYMRMNNKGGYGGRASREGVAAAKSGLGST